MNELNTDGAAVDPPAHPEKNTAPQSTHSVQVTDPQVDAEQTCDAENDLKHDNKQPVQRQPEEKLAEQTLQRNTYDYIYALGQVDIVFPNEGIKRQFLSAATELGVDDKAYYAVFTNLSQPVDSPSRNRYLYLAEQVDWVLSIKQAHSYVLNPATPAELQALIEALQPPKNTLETVYTCVIGHITSSHSSLDLPEVVCQQIYHHTLSQLHHTIQKISRAETNAIQDVIRALEVEPNPGRSDFDRAKNFVAFRYPDIYAQTHKMNAGANSLPSASLVRITFSRFDALSDHRIVDITLTYKENTSTRHHYYFCRVDVSGLYPFINTEIQSFMPLQTM
ncbi:MULTISPECIES: hypothetical protein [unclassified Pseudoalteromonas]|uniref:cyanobactin maturation protease PatG family protein n=1 Tax=unclassified Pseudoalteromonas TaxID=194690 RepID=UPI0020978E7F|nr:hypothetical protein [Pseudoalteromonas sp. XMcav2-N]MCO7189559.1 hypothetical protein [Pseudoalteromonas sp. XMcav2-N]